MVLLATLLLLASGQQSRADIAPGMAAFRSGGFGEALQDWESQAASGDATAALLVGVLFDTGEGVHQDAAVALSWYRRAAEGGSATGMFNVGVMYDAGHGVPEDRSEAARWYARGAAAGSGRADYNLALLYQSGDGVARDPGRAIQLFQAAAAHGVTAARSHLAQLGRPYAGRVTVGKEEVALQQFEQAEKALLNRGTAEASQAVELFRRSAEGRNPLAEYDLGYCYENGIGVAADKLQAYAWYSRAAADARQPAVKSVAEIGAKTLARQFSQAELDRAQKQLANSAP